MFSRSDVIDLTEELHKTAADRPPGSTAAAANMEHVCPICHHMFADSVIERHASECLAAAQGGLSEEEEGVASSDDEIPSRRVRVARKSREAGPGEQETGRKSHQLTLDAFGSTSSRVTGNAGNGESLEPHRLESIEQTKYRSIANWVPNGFSQLVGSYFHKLFSLAMIFVF